MSSETSPHHPEDWPRLFELQLNAGNLHAVMALYEPEARFVAPSGKTLIGRDHIRDVIARLIDTRTRLRSRVVKAVIADDIALLSTDFEGTTNQRAGETVLIRHKAIEVLRRQPDGTWKLIIGHPHGRE